MSDCAAPGRPRLRVALLKAWVRIAGVIRPGELEITLFWAGIVGFLGAISTLLFRHATEWVHWALTGSEGGYVESFYHLAWWQRLLVPCVGGALAGLTLRYASRFKPKKESSTDYMEAIVLGNGVVSSRVSLVKSLSALFSIASGASIGREGPLVQLAAMLASLVGRILRVPTVRLRLLVACGAAAGIASAYNAPIAGALFVAEIILGSLSMQSFGPLVFSSVVATVTTRHFLGIAPIYQIVTPPVQTVSGLDMLPYLLLGFLAGGLAPFFLRGLRGSQRIFTKLPGPAFLRLAAGGLVVGALAVFYPEVCGNGHSVLNGLLHGEYAWGLLATILVMKLFATAATFGSGAVGGVFTPTLFIGACLGNLMAGAALAIWPHYGLRVSDFALVGMGAFLAATTHAPIMAMLMLFELTLDAQIILPLMLACVVAFYVSRSIEPQSMYSHSLQEKGAGIFRRELAEMPVSGIMRNNPVTVSESAHFGEIAQRFLANRFNYLYVVDDGGRFTGVISLHDIKAYLDDPHLASLVIARDLTTCRVAALAEGASFAEALKRFSAHDGERLPVTAEDGRLIGSLSKADLMLALAEVAK